MRRAFLIIFGVCCVCVAVVYVFFDLELLKRGTENQVAAGLADKNTDPILSQNQSDWVKRHDQETMLLASSDRNPEDSKESSQRSDTREPESFAAARNANWRSQNVLQSHNFRFVGECKEQNKTALKSDILQISRINLDAEQEFPMTSHVAKWEMAFGLPEPGTLIWAQWNGNMPPTYTIFLQDASGLTREDFSPSKNQMLKVTPIEIETSLDWPGTVGRLQTLITKYQELLGEPNYRRILVTQFAPISPMDLEVSVNKEKKPNIMGEFLNDRILAFASSQFDCQSIGLYELSCSCRDK